jgi:hypothetical protein
MVGAGILQLHCLSGLAGDMFLGACLDLGMPITVLEEVVERLGLDGVTVEARRGRRGGIAGVRFRVLVGGRALEGPDPEEGPPVVSDAEPGPTVAAIDLPHDYRGIRRLLERSGLEPPVRERAVELFSRLAEAEARVHGIDVDEVHFHEVGAADSIVDVVGAAAAVAHLAPRRLVCSTVVVGGGTVETEHGLMPVPAPATVELLRGIPVRGSSGGELVTPTGALLLAELVDAFEELPPMCIVASGYGLGRRELEGRPNVCRLLAGETESPTRPEVMVVECEVDDLPGEGFGFLMESLLEAGALDVYFTAVQMKKNRPGTLVTMLCREADLEPLAGVLLAESGSLGCRYSRAARIEAEREVRALATRFGRVRIKRATLRGRLLGEKPEYEDCRRLAQEHGVTWREVYAEAIRHLQGAAGG